MPAQLNKQDDKLKLNLMIDPSGITLEQSVDKDNRKAKVFEGTRATVVLDLSQERYQAMTQSGLRYVKGLHIHPKADRLEIVVRDNISTMIGSLRAT